MAAKASTAEHDEHHADRQHETKAKPELVLVDLSRRQSTKRIRRLRKGRGALVTRIDEIVAELVESGTVKAGVQPVVIIVREKVSMPWPFTNMEPDYDEDEDEDEDEDD
jgi:DNA-binding TFAR19-related protein (PDSD5 family)